MTEIIKLDLIKTKGWPSFIMNDFSLFQFSSLIFKKLSLNNIKKVEFRSESSCTDHIHTLQIVFKQCTDSRSPPHPFFIDFEKVFESLSSKRIGGPMQPLPASIMEKLIATIRAYMMVERIKYWLRYHFWTSLKRCPERLHSVVDIIPCHIFPQIHQVRWEHFFALSLNWR